jgi:hypothetical protein
MSSTYVVGKAAAACVDERGTVYFLLHEKSYESNVHPQNPRWSVRHFGTYDSCIARMIKVSSAIEGGCLRGDARSPSAFIKHWRDKFEQPMRLRKTVITQKFGSGFYDLPLEHVDAVNALLQVHGFAKVADNRLSIDMESDGALALLAEMVDGRFSGIYPWRLFDKFGPFGEPSVGIGAPIPPAVKANMPHQVFTLGKEHPGLDDTHVISGPEGIRMTGWSYSTMASFIEREVVEMERRVPGSAEPAIAAFRKILKAKRPLPATYNVLVKSPEEEGGDRYYRDCFGRLCEELQIQAGPLVFITPAKLTPAAVRELGYLGDRFVSFSDVGQRLVAGGGQQLDLLSECQS